MKDEHRYKEVSDDILREMNAWNASHPKATFLEIEVKARELVSQLEAHLIQGSRLRARKRGVVALRASRTAKLSHVPGAPALTRQARPTFTS